MKEFNFIDKKLKQKEYENFEDYEKELKIFYSFFQENAPDLPNKSIIILDFLYRALLEGITNLFPQNLKISFTKSDEFSTTLKEKTVQSSLEKVLSDQRSINHNLNEELEKELSILRRDYEFLKLENKRLESENKATFSLKFKMSEFEEDFKAKSRDSMIIESEYRKELALLRQKLEFHERTIDDMTRKTKDHSQEIKTLKTSHYTEIKELTLKYETLNKSLELEIKQMKDKTQELQTELEHSSHKLAKEKENCHLSEAYFKAIIQQDNDNIKELRKELQELKKQDLEKSEKLKSYHEKNFEELNETLKNVEENYRTKEKAYKDLKILYERDKAVLGQKIEFLEMELKEIKEKKTETTSIQDAFFKALELSEDYSKNPKIDENLEKFKAEIKRFDEENRCLKGKVECKDHEIDEIKRFKSKDLEEMRKLQGQILELRSLNERLRLEANDSQTLFTNELEKIITLKNTLETDHNNLKTKYAKEQTLWNEKFQNLSEDLQDADRKLHVALKLRNDDKEMSSKNQVNLIESMEKKHFQQMNELSGFYENKIEDYKKKTILVNSNKINDNKVSCSLNSLKSLRNLDRCSSRGKFNEIQDTIDLEKEALKNRIYELEQALTDSEARREIQKNELKREKSKQNLTIHENPKPEIKALRKSVNIYNTLQNPITTPKGQGFTSVKGGGRSPHMKENNKFSFHSKKPSYTDKSFMFLNMNEGTGYSLNELNNNGNTNNCINKSILLNQRNSSLEEQDLLFDLKRLK